MKVYTLKSDRKNRRVAVLDESGQVLGYASLDDVMSLTASKQLEEQIALTMKEKPALGYGAALREVVKKNPEVWRSYQRTVLQGSSN